MMPGNALSNPTVRADWLEPDSWERSSSFDWERGGVAVNNPALGINGFNWKGWKDQDGNIWVNRVDGLDSEKTYMMFEPSARNIGLSFDRNMNPCICYEKGSHSYLYWYDSLSATYVTSFFEAAYSPAVTHDDKRSTDNVTLSDILFFYIRGTTFYMRMQRDRFTVEYPLRTLPPEYRLKRVGMGRNLRLQFWFIPPE